MSMTEHSVGIFSELLAAIACLPDPLNGLMVLTVGAEPRSQQRAPYN